MTVNATALRVFRFIKQHRRALRTVDFVAGVSRGGLIPAALLAARINKPLITLYIDQHDRVCCDRKKWIHGKRVLLVDDIVRTGKTLTKMITLLKRASAREVKTFTLFCLKSAKMRPTWSRIINNDKRMPWDFS